MLNAACSWIHIDVSSHGYRVHQRPAQNSLYTVRSDVVAPITLPIRCAVSYVNPRRNCQLFCTAACRLSVTAATLDLLK
jgi:hypothetical protein